MKIEQQQEPFNPVVITLTSQKEVDCMVAIFNITVISDLLGKNGVTVVACYLIDSFATAYHTVVFHELIQELERTFKDSV